MKDARVRRNARNDDVTYVYDDVTYGRHRRNARNARDARKG